MKLRITIENTIEKKDFATTRNLNYLFFRFYCRHKTFFFSKKATARTKKSTFSNLNTTVYYRTQRHHRSHSRLSDACAILKTRKAESVRDKERRSALLIRGHRR